VLWAQGGALPKTTGKEKVDVLNQLSEKYQNTAPKQARKYAQEAMELAQDLAYTLGEALAYKNIGVVYHLQGNNSQAIEFFLKALKLYEKERDEVGIAHTLHDIGVVYQGLQKYAEAQQYYDRVLALDHKLQDKKGEASTLNNIADLYYQQEQTDKALAYYEQSLQIRQSIADSAGIAISLKNIGLVKHTQNQFKTALAYYFKSLKIDETLQNVANQSATLVNVAEAYLKLQQIDSSEIFALRSLKLAEGIAMKREMIYASGILADIYDLKKNFEKALEYKNLQAMLKEEVFNEENTHRISELQNSYELDKAQAQNELLKKSRQFDRLLLGSGAVGSLLLVALLLVLYRSNQRKQKANALLKEQNEAILLKNAEINQQKEEIEAQRDAIESQLIELAKQRDTIEDQKNEISEKSEHIESSIRYALRIQQAMLPYEQLIDESLPYNFIFYLPRDVVSGDFYWFGKIDATPIYEERETFDGIQRTLMGFQNELIVIAAIDCTGHGVPGAFMSMIGNAQLNQIVKDGGITKADKILNQLHKGIRASLKQSETQNRDGMDLALCVIDQEAKTVEYAGAKNELIYIQNGTLGELKASNRSVGGHQDEDEKERVYEANSLSYAISPLKIYLYSDGYQDQFGGAEGKKFMRKNLKRLLMDIHEEPMAFQKDILEKTFLDWKGNYFQVDDVLVMGIKLE
jgi:tetratricopeptide (TPR) repeat protein